MTEGAYQRLVIISGPSGAGKSTVVRELLAACPLPLVMSISATTRQPRRGEVHGEDYYFLTPDQFAARREAGDFLECKEYAGNWYGTLQSQVIVTTAATQVVPVLVNGVANNYTATIAAPARDVIDIQQRLAALLVVPTVFVAVPAS